MSEFIATYKKVNSNPDKAKCWFAKILGAHVVTPLGRIMLLPTDYEYMEKQYNEQRRKHDSN